MGSEQVIQFLYQSSDSRYELDQSLWYDDCTEIPSFAGTICYSTANLLNNLIKGHIRSDEQRTDVKCCTSLIWRDETLIQAHHLIDHLVEFLGRQFWHQNATASALQTCCIL